MNGAKSLFLLLLLVPASAGAKPLYITVPRTFSTTERAQVNVAFAGKEPVELRILKPDALDKFVTDQANLRRAYVAPTTQLNPGRYLSIGTNAVQSPGSFLYYAMSDTFRKAVAPSLPERPERPRDLQRMKEGPEKLVSNPPGMTLVKSQWLNLDLGGDTIDFNVPGFDAWGGSSGYQERTVQLAPMSAGLYVLQLVQGTIEGQVTLVVTDQTVQVKQTDGRLLVRVAGRDQKPVANAAITVFAPGKQLASGTSDKNGEAILEVTAPKVLVLSKRDADVAIIDTDFYSTLAIAPDVFIYSDRPIYKPGDDVQFRGVVRKPASFLAELLLPKKRSVEVQMLLQSGGPLKTTATIDEFGSFFGKLSVPAGTPTGVVRLVATVEAAPKDSAEHQAEARVQDYVKPTFFLEVTSQQEGVKPGEKITVKVRARRYAGGVPKNTKYEYFLYRTQLETAAWVDDAGKGGQGSAVTYGSASTTEGKLSLPKRLYSSLQTRMENAQPDADPWATAPAFDKNGEATISVDVPALEEGEARMAFKYTLSVKAKDEQNSEAVASKPFFLSDSDVVAQVGLGKKLLKKDEPAMVAVRAQTLSGKSFGACEGTLTFFLRDSKGEERKLDEKPVKLGDDGVVRVALPTGFVGTVIARASLKDKKGRSNENEAEALIIGSGGEAVANVPALTTEALGDVLEPGAIAELAALFPEGWGPGGKDAGSVWITLSGSTIFSTSRADVSGRTFVHRFTIEKRFGSVIYASIAYPTASGRWDERSAAFRIVPKTRVLNVRVEPGKAEATPLGEQTIALNVTNSDGEGVQASVSLGVVDKAVYALQAEFRPSVIDFFYPVARNNVSSFYSMEFQGYGYGEQLARMKLGLRPYEFAAVKPPSRRPKDLDRDTAFWSPSIVTAKDGHATVAFKMPSNQTLWVVTAVAADASGRFGEGRAEFASRGNLSLALMLPQFLRAGDEAQGSVRVALGAEGKAGQRVALDLGGAGVTPMQKDVTLAKGDEQIVPVSVKASATGAIVADLKATIGSEALADHKRVDVHPAAIEERIAVSAYGGGELQLAAAGDRLLAPAELVLVPGSVDAALSSVEDLLTYPFGCLEQLVATTIPNIALYHLLQKSQTLSRLDPQSQALMQLARSRAMQGTDRILALAQKGGGFTWFSGYTTPSVALTLIALDGLSYAIDAGVVPKEASEVTESAKWLEGADDLPFALDATRAYVLARLDGPKAAARVRSLVDKVEPSGDLYSLAIVSLAANEAGIANEAGLKDRLAGIVAKSKTLLTQNAALTDAAYYTYPLRHVGLAAIVAHATSGNITDADLKDARKRFIQAVASPELSTFDRSTMLLHHLWLIEKDAKTMQAMTAPGIDVKGGATLAPRGFGMAATLPQGVTSVKVQAFDGVATLQARASTPFASVQAKSEGMSIQRTYYLLRDQGRKKLSEGEVVKVGDEVYVELEFNAQNGEQWKKLRSAYYVIEDGVPAGFVVLSEDKTYRVAPYGLPLAHEALKQRAFTPEKATFFFEEPAFWSDSPRTIGYVMRAQFAGKFQAPPATITDMYAAKVNGRTKAGAITVQGR
ncbi:MAG: alpha-2-macroglobulin [Deltaproteobacteria bacterium]|nr:alpha-2-macroglobulin [Deltaproteobacteria bacterium]